MSKNIKPIQALNSIKLFILLLTITVGNVLHAQIQMNFEFDTPYGNNDTLGQYAEINGTKIYYEVYGEGEVLLLIHGNGSNIHGMGNQIDYFKENYQVIVADNRGHGKSELPTDSLTYRQIAADYEALIQHLKIDSLSIVGWSDGGIVSLIIGVNNKIKTNRIVAMAPNIRPDSTALYPWMINYCKNAAMGVSAMIAQKDTTQDWHQKRQQLQLILTQPHISHSELGNITTPVLIIAGDKDLVKEAHIVEIYQHIPNAHLAILPGETHFTPASNPKLFNEITKNFISKPFKRPDSDFTKW